MTELLPICMYEWGSERQSLCYDNHHHHNHGALKQCPLQKTAPVEMIRPGCRPSWFQCNFVCCFVYFVLFSKKSQFVLIKLCKINCSDTEAYCSTCSIKKKICLVILNNNSMSSLFQQNISLIQKNKGGGGIFALRPISAIISDSSSSWVVE